MKRSNLFTAAYVSRGPRSYVLGHFGLNTIPAHVAVLREQGALAAITQP